MAVLPACRLGLVVCVATAVITATMVLATPSYACACGAAVTAHGSQATLNHEVALLHWDGTTETIVMQLAMNADTDNVALVVPTPTPAIVTTADQSTFGELDTLSAPLIEHQRHWSLRRGVGASGPQEAAARAPHVLNQVRLGPLEATTLTGGDLSGLQTWLSDNGYAIRPAVSAALDPYVRDGWAFVAIRLTSTDLIVGGLDPVRMTFRSSRLVYPMRLSVAAQEPQHVTIFTLSDHRQQRTDADAATQTTHVRFAGDMSTAVRDPLLRELIGNHGSYLTKVEVDIYQTSRISSDFTFGNAPNDDPYRQVVTVYDDVALPAAAGGRVGDRGGRGGRGRCGGSAATAARPHWVVRHGEGAQRGRDSGPSDKPATAGCAINRSKTPLPLEQFGACPRYRKPAHPVDLGELTHLARALRPVNSKVLLRASVMSRSARTPNTVTTLPPDCFSDPKSIRGPSGTHNPISSENSRRAASHGSSPPVYSPFGIDQAPSSFPPKTGRPDAPEGRRRHRRAPDTAAHPR